MSWLHCRLGDIYDVRDGTHDSPKYVDEGFPLITSKNLKDGEIDFENVQYISQKDYDSISKRSFVKKNDVLLAMIGTIGNPVVVKTDIQFAIKNVALFKTNETQSPDFLKYFLMSPLVQAQMLNDAKGATQKFVGLGYLRNFMIPNPPLTTQQKIVERLDAIFAEIDKATAAAEANVKNAEALFQGYLTDIFERGDRDWSIYKFDDIVENKQVGLVKNSYEQIQNGEYSYFKMNNISNNNQCDLRMLARVNVTEEELNKYRLIKNDFLFNTRNSKELVGKVCVFHGEESDNILYNNNIMRIRFKSFVDPDFILQAFSYKKTRLQLDRLKTGATNVAAIYYKDLKTLSLPIPNIDKQANVIDSLKNLHIQIDALIKTNKSKIELLSSLRQSIFIRAFNGKLVKD